MYNRIDLYRLLDSVILHWYGHGTQTRYTNKQIKKKGVIYLHFKKNYIQGRNQVHSTKQAKRQTAKIQQTKGEKLL